MSDESKSCDERSCENCKELQGRTKTTYLCPHLIEHRIGWMPWAMRYILAPICCHYAEPEPTALEKALAVHPLNSEYRIYEIEKLIEGVK